jgi:hypothetical protein
MFLVTEWSISHKTKNIVTKDVVRRGTTTVSSSIDISLGLGYRKIRGIRNT